MAFISVTRLRVRSIIYLPAFFMANERCVKTLVRTPGFISGKELPDKHFTFWTTTVWSDVFAMKQFRNSPAHRKAMQQLPRWCNEASYVHWEAASDASPSWQELYNRMLSDGVLTKVRKPSPHQFAKDYPPPKWTKLERIFKPLS